MRHFLLTVLIFSTSVLYSSTGDTVKIRSHNGVLIQTDPSKGHTEYAAKALFPSQGKSWRKMYVELTMKCPPGMTCGEWDYVNAIHLFSRKNGNNWDTLDWEVARFITAYGLQFNNTWSHTWRWDITDFTNLFHDSVEIWYHHSGYEAKNGRGWIIDVDFTMIEGPAPAEITHVEQMLQRGVPYGNDSLFDALVPTDTFTVKSNTRKVRYKIIQTGHGNDGKDACGEFCAKYRYIVLDGKPVDTSLVWRDDCGSNAVYPQAGTWIYDRANWCPGADVKEYNFDFDVEPGSTHSLDMDMESYQGGGNYYLTLFRIEYGENHYSHDISLEEIVKPGDEDQYLRVNPSCGNPEIRIKNTGSKTVNDLWISYGWKGFEQKRYHWTGNLKPQQFAQFEMPYMGADAPVGTAFQCRVIWVNNQKDDNESNDYIQSVPINRVTQMNGNFVIILRTNNAASETYYTLKSADGTLIRKRENLANTTLYRDTVNLPEGCYMLNLMDDGTPPAAYPLNKDGLGWWANSYDGTGMFQLRAASGNTLIKNFAVDFGTGYWYQFRVGNSPAPATAVETLKMYPNPAENDVLIDLGANMNGTLKISIVNYLGQKLIEETRTGDLDALQFVDISKIPSGIYIAKIQAGSRSITQKMIKR